MTTFGMSAALIHEKGRTAIGGYPDTARRLQGILLREGLATKDIGQGVSYCFSRNF